MDIKKACLQGNYWGRTGLLAHVRERRKAGETVDGLESIYYSAASNAFASFNTRKPLSWHWIIPAVFFLLRAAKVSDMHFKDKNPLTDVGPDEVDVRASILTKIPWRKLEAEVLLDEWLCGNSLFEPSNETLQLMRITKATLLWKRKEYVKAADVFDEIKKADLTSLSPLTKVRILRAMRDFHMCAHYEPGVNMMNGHIAELIAHHNLDDQRHKARVSH